MKQSVSDEEKKYSLYRGLKVDRRFREATEPYATFHIIMPESYEEFKNEVLTWNIGNESWRAGVHKSHEKIETEQVLEQAMKASTAKK